MSEYHTPVLLEKSVSALVSTPDGVYVDATFGGGGHSRAVLSRLSERGRLIAFDRDPDALANCGSLAEDERFTLVQDNFRFVQNYVEWYLREGETVGDVGGWSEGEKGREGEPTGTKKSGLKGEPTVTEETGWRGIDGIIADLGVSSHQFDTPERGFSFRFDAPLDMRMGGETQKRTAAEIVNTYSEDDLALLLHTLGEVQGSGRMAGLIVRARAAKPIQTTTDLNAAIASTLPERAEHKVLAKVYQALRIEVNGEMRNLEKFLEGAAASLRTGGRLVVITYHSLEDRMVKNFMRDGNIEGERRADLYGRVNAPMRPVEKKPIVPSEEEIAGNTRARSAKLRIAEKI